MLPKLNFSLVDKFTKKIHTAEANIEGCSWVKKKKKRKSIKTPTKELSSKTTS